MPEPDLLRGYPDALRADVRGLVARGELGAYLAARYPRRHEVQSDKALYAYAVALKNEHLKTAPPLDRVVYDAKLDVVHRALGLHTARSRVHGDKLRATREIRVASLFKWLAPELLEMIVVHELAHLRHREHDKPFYQLCEHMLPSYHQRELDLRLHLVLSASERGGPAPTPHR